jgi:hypothetical protein
MGFWAWLLHGDDPVPTAVPPSAERTTERERARVEARQRDIWERVRRLEAQAAALEREIDPDVRGYQDAPGD